MKIDVSEIRENAGFVTQQDLYSLLMTLCDAYEQLEKAYESAKEDLENAVI